MRSAEAEAGRLGNARLMNFASFSLLPALLAQGRGSASQPSSQCITNQLSHCRWKVEKADARLPSQILVTEGGKGSGSGGPAAPP